jgi:hypothetical protein
MVGTPPRSGVKLPRISSWGDHDALVYNLIGHMMVTKPSRTKSVFHWAKSKTSRIFAS